MAGLFAIPYPPLVLTQNGASVSLTWMAPEAGLILQQTEFLGPNAAWSNTTNLVSANGPTHVVHQTLEMSNRFYRLRYP